MSEDRVLIKVLIVSHYAPRIWNSLPTTVRSADSYDSFKARRNVKCVALKLTAVVNNKSSRTVNDLLIAMECQY